MSTKTKDSAAFKPSLLKVPGASLLQLHFPNPFLGGIYLEAVLRWPSWAGDSPGSAYALSSDEVFLCICL